MKTLEEIRAILSAHKPDLRKRYKVREIGIFGSLARGEEGQRSDIDILVELESDGLTFDNYMELRFFLEDAFSAKVDLVIKHSIKESLKPFILDEVIYV